VLSACGGLLGRVVSSQGRQVIHNITESIQGKTVADKRVKQEGLEFCYNDDELYCIIIRDGFNSETTVFFTPDNFSQQLGFLPHKKNAVIKPHMHLYNKREVFYTQEVLFIKSGKVKVNFYDSDEKYVFSEIVEQGDFILLCGGGHGFEMIEDTRMIEIKQGPFQGEDDKRRFKGIE
jgi:mannose-6-phosphate isomerase-like protein (cupin superfamily)